MIKRTVAYLLTILTLCCTLNPVYAHFTDEQNERPTTTEEYQIDCLAPDTLFPFIYSDSEDWQFWRDYIGDCDCDDGYLYVKDKTTGEIVQILPEKVLCFRETQEFLYCVTEDNLIKQVDYNGENAEVLYEASFGVLSELEYHAVNLFFIDGEYIVRFCLYTNEADVVADSSGIVSIYPYDMDKLLLTTENETYLVCDLVSGTLAVMEDQNEAENIWAPSYVSMETADGGMSRISTYVQNGIDYSFPLDEYPVGSYFTISGDACTDHSNKSITHYDGNCNCKVYGRASQCMGFARYASDRYAHLTFKTSSSNGWLKQRGACAYINEKAPDEDNLDTATAVREAFAKLTVGAYVRLNRLDGETRAKDSGHSFVIVKFTSNGVITYDCNVKGQCDISLVERTYNSIANSSFAYVANTVSHDFTGPIAKYSAAYHAVYCEGCSGYILKSHYTTSASSRTCDECGYVGNISVIVA